MFYSHIVEMCNLCEITEGQFLQGIVGGLYILQMVNWKKGDSNPHSIATVRFWVWCVYQFHHLGNTDIIDEIPILVKTQTIEILPESSSKFLKISSQNPTKSSKW